MSTPKFLLTCLSLVVSATACGDSGTTGDGQCPAGSGAIFVENGPQGAGCYCPAGTFPDAATSTCIANPCAAQYGAFARPDDAGDCVDIDECAEGTAGCDAHATCTNVTRDAPRCACASGYSGDGTTCTLSGACEPLGHIVDNACVDVDECTEGTSGCAPTAICTNHELAAATCACPENSLGDGKTCTACPTGYTVKPGFNTCQDIDECYQDLDDCDPNGRCFNNPGGFTCGCDSGGFIAVGNACVCPVGTTLDGDHCADVDECDEGLDDCDDDATCNNYFGSYSCRCPLGFEGDGFNCLPIVCPPGFAFQTSGTFVGTCQDVNECLNDTDGCDQNQICINLKGSVRCDCQSSNFVKDDGGHCVCKPGYQLVGNACQDINECTGNALGCSTDATCTNLDGTAVCRCKPGFAGDGFTCEATVCPAGYQSGLSGCIDTNECANGTSGCSPNANCFNTSGGFTCQCKIGYSGNGTSCSPTTCPTGYALSTSGTCQDVNECYNGTDTCAANAICLNTQGAYNCACNSGFVGDGRNCTCPAGKELIGSQCADINECATGAAQCDVNATCTNSIGSFSCRCKTGYEGDGTSCVVTPCGPGYKSGPNSTCVDADECATNTDDCDPNATCTNTTGNFTCTCKLGFEGTGQQCAPVQCGPGFEFKVSGANAGSCVDVNECSANTHDCSLNANCSNTSGGFTCACKTGYAGDGHTCTCAPGFKVSGSTCVDVNECGDNIDDCDSHAACQNLSGTYSCRCNTGYQGDGRSCVATPCSAGFETPAGGGACVDSNECALGTSDCDPHATCSNTSGSFTCACMTGYTGSGKTCTLNTCSAGMRVDATTGACVDVNECLEGTSGCNANANCANTSGSFTCTCKPGYEGNGTTTCTDVDECTKGTDNCAQICTNRAGGYDCSCGPGYTADLHFCQELNECADAAALGCLGDCVNTTGGFQCFGEGGISSLANPGASPYPNMQCAGAVGPEAIWFQTGQKTSFPVDCRCPQGASEPGHFLCAAPTGAETVGQHYGTGPNAADHTNGYIEGCSTDYDKDVVYFGVTWGDSHDSRRGFVIKVDPTNGNRTVVSGQYYDPALGLREVGTGNRFDSIKDVALGSDGFLYVFEDSVPGTGAEYEDTNPDLQGRSIYKVNLTNGNRTLIWTMNTTAHPEFVNCSNGKPANAPGYPWIDIRNKQFELDEGNNFILATNRNMSPSPGNGFIRVGNDGKSCTWITRDGTEPTNLLFNAAGGGSGVVVSGGFDSGFGYHDGKIYATNFTTGRLFEVDVATGQRSILWSGANPVLGTGPGPGVYNFFYYPLFDLWVAGGNEPNTPSNAALFDPETGSTWGWMFKRPAADSTGTVGSGTGGNDAWAGPPGVVTNQLRGPILGVLYETLHHRPWCISPTEPDRLLVATDRIGIVKVEVETGNTMNFSQ